MHRTLWVVLLAALAGSACSSRELRLPAGDVARGRAVFAEMDCRSCHEVAGEPVLASARAHVRLGGQVAMKPSPADLANEIVHPSADLSPHEYERDVYFPQTRMPHYVDRLTVRQLADVTAYVESAYEEQVDPMR